MISSMRSIPRLVSPLQSHSQFRMLPNEHKKSADFVLCLPHKRYKSPTLAAEHRSRGDRFHRDREFNSFCVCCGDKSGRAGKGFLAITSSIPIASSVGFGRDRICRKKNRIRDRVCMEEWRRTESDITLNLARPLRRVPQHSEVNKM